MLTFKAIFIEDLQTLGNDLVYTEELDTQKIMINSKATFIKTGY